MAEGPIKGRSGHLIIPVALFLALGGTVLAEENLQPGGLEYTGIYQLRQAEPNLTGAGVSFAVVCRSFTYVDGEPQNDYRPATDHNCFKNARYALHDQRHLPADISPHSTAVCSILFGRDPNGYNEQVGNFQYEGAAFEAQAEIYEFWHFLINNVFPGVAPEANIITADVGYQFEDWWTRGIESLAQRYGLPVIIGIGNGSNASDPVLYPGAGANVIGVGVVKSVRSDNPATGLSHFALAYPEYSSKGPTSDGRCKPDIVAPGNCLAAGLSEPNLYEPTGDWSSFAAPVVAGTVGLLVQKAGDDANLAAAVSAQGGNCVIKAVLLNSATKLPYWRKGRLSKEDDHQVPLDYLQGAGMVNAVGAYKQLTAGQHLPGDCPPAGWDLNKLNRDQAADNTYRIRIQEPAGKVISATVVWNRHFAAEYPFEHQRDKDADLRLEVWAVDANDPNSDYLLDYSDSVADNIEHIYCPADPNVGEYEIVVLYGDGDTNQSAAAPYAAAWDVESRPAGNDALWFDLNADGVVNNLDVTVLLDNLLASIESPDRYAFGDVNSDGILDVKDLNILLNHIDAGQKADQPDAADGP